MAEQDIAMVITRRGDVSGVHLLVANDGLPPALHTVSGEPPDSPLATVISALWAELQATRCAEIMSAFSEAGQVGIVSLPPAHRERAFEMITEALSIMDLPESGPVPEAIVLL